MKKPPLSDAASTLRKDYGVYHLTRLQADKEAKPLAEPFNQAQIRLKQKEDALEAAYDSIQAAMAVRDGEDEALDSSVRDFYGALVTASHNRKDSPIFARYFPDGMTTVELGVTSCFRTRGHILLSGISRLCAQLCLSRFGTKRASRRRWARFKEVERAEADSYYRTRSASDREG